MEKRIVIPPNPIGKHELVLYKFDACPYCQRVFKALEKHKVVVTLRDTVIDVQARNDLIQLTGRTQVPCLVIDGRPLFESLEIVEWLRAYAGQFY